LQLQVSNYNPITGVWTDTSGNNDTATYYGTLPTLQTGVTPNGSSAVNLIGNGGFNLVSSITGGSGYTVFAFIKPLAPSGGRYALTGGSSPYALEYNIYSGHQNWLSEYQGGGGAGTATISTSSFSLIDVTASTSGGSFNLNGSPDGTTGGTAGGTPFSPLTRIGNNEGGGDGFAGSISEIDIYQGVLTSSQIATVEANFTAEYITAVPEPTTWAMMAGGFGMLFATRRFRRSEG